MNGHSGYGNNLTIAQRNKYCDNKEYGDEIGEPGIWDLLLQYLHLDKPLQQQNTKKLLRD